MLVLLQTIFFTLGVHPNVGRSQLITNTPIDQLIGINARPQDIAIPGISGRLQKFSHVRSFHRWGEDVGAAADNRAKIVEDWNPSVAQNNPDNFEYLRYRYNLSFNGNLPLRMDQFYGNMGGTAFPTMFAIAPVMRGIVENQFSVPEYDQKPVNLVLNHGYTNAPNVNDYPAPGLLVANPAASPNNYRSHTLNLSMFAARYGLIRLNHQYWIRTRLVQPHLSPAEMNPDAISLNSVDYMEVYNEPDKEWFDVNKALGSTTHKQWPMEHAAMLSAAYDGHCRDPFFRIPNPYNEGRDYYLGIKNISPPTQVVMGGLANMRGNHIERMIDWFDTHRAACGTRLPFDVLNYHHYSFKRSTEKSFKFHYEDETETLLFAAEPFAATPEEDEIKLKMRYFAFRLKTTKPEVQDKPIWITEIGYDSEPYDLTTSPATAYHQTPNGPRFGQRPQAQWVMRMLLEAAASKVMERVTLYEIADLGYAGLYANCGVIGHTGIPKESWYYVQTLRNVLKGAIYQGRLKGEVMGNIPTDYYRYPNPDGSLPQDDAPFEALLREPDVDPFGGEFVTASPALATIDPKPIIYRFSVKGDVGNQIYAIWSPTKTDKSYTATVRFKTENYVNRATLVTTINLDENGRHDIWSKNLSPDGQNPNHTVVSAIPVSETPIFVILGLEKQDTLPATVPANLVTVSAGCCSDVKVNFPTWKFNRYVLYYADAAQYQGNILDISHPAIRMFELPFGTRPPVSLPGLNLTPGQQFIVWILPYRYDYATNTFSNIPSPLPVGVTLTAPAACNACVLPIVASGISSTFAGGTGIGQSIFVHGTATPPCTMLQDILTNISWDNGQPFGPDNTITLDFGTTVRIETGKYFDGQGQGTLTFEYLDCCNAWQPLTSLDLSLYNQWRDAPGLSCYAKALRVHRDNPDAKVYKILLCGYAAACPTKPPGLEPSKPFVDVPLVGTETARIEWTPSWKYAEDPEVFKNYEISYSHLWDESGVLMNPVVIKTGLLNGDVQTKLLLRNLLSGTDYRGTVKPSPQETTADCGEFDGVIPVGFFGFKTKEIPEIPEDRSYTAPEIYPISCAPNPATGRTMVTIPEPGYFQLEMIEMATSRTVMTIALDETATTIPLETSHLISGQYLIRAVHRAHVAAYTPLTIIKG